MGGKKLAQKILVANALTTPFLHLQDSGVGVYAGDEETYTAFEALFGPLIEDYHKGHKMTDTHPSDMDPSHLDAPNPDPEGKYVISTRIRVARNLKGYPLQPTNTKEKLLEIEQTVSGALETFEGELKGKYYPLDGMDEATSQQLIDDHFLFKKGDRYAHCTVTHTQHTHTQTQTILDP